MLANNYIIYVFTYYVCAYIMEIWYMLYFEALKALLDARVRLAD